MNLQNVFNIVNFGAWKQKAQSTNPVGCIYRDKERNRRCFIGMLLTDDQINEIDKVTMDNANALYQNFGFMQARFYGLKGHLLTLQYIHDKDILQRDHSRISGVPHWESRLKRFAEKRKLHYTPWSTFDAQKAEDEAELAPLEGKVSCTDQDKTLLIA